MARYEITAPDGSRWEVTAPEGASEQQVLTYAKSQWSGGSAGGEESLLGGAAEFGKGLVRGAGETASIIPKALGKLAGPVVGQLIDRGTEALAAPSKELVAARPAGEMERAAGTVGEVIGASVAGGGGATPAALARHAGVGALAAGGEAIGDETGRLIGTVAPLAAGSIARGLHGAVQRRIDPKLMREFEAAGIDPSLGQATKLSFIQGLENLAAKFPGGAGVMRRFVDAQQRSLGRGTSVGGSAEQAGRAIEKGAMNYVDRSLAKWKELDEAVSSKIGGTWFQLVPENTLKALDDLAAPLTGAPGATARLAAERKQLVGLLADIEPGKRIPWETLRKIRSRIGEMTTEALVSGRPQGEIKKLYGALSQDLKNAAYGSGMRREFDRANRYYALRQERIEDILQRVVGKEGSMPEDVFKRFMPKDPQAAGKVRAVMRSLNPEERKVVTKAVVERLGKAAPGKQDEFGEVFSSETFLTNWNKLSPGARMQLFSDSETRKAMNAIAHAAANIRESAKLYANPSGTAGSFAAYSIYTSPLAAGSLLLAGQPGAALGVALGAGGTALAANLGSRMLTNPKLVKWLATPLSPRNPKQIAAHLARLNTIRDESDPQTQAEIDKFISTVSQ